MSLKLRGISLLAAFILLSVNSLFANQIIFDKIEPINDLSKSSYISEIGDNQKTNFIDLFDKKKYEDIQNFLRLYQLKTLVLLYKI